MRLGPRLPGGTPRAYGATDFTYHYRLVAMCPGRSGALRGWKGLDREPFRHRPGMSVTPTAAFPAVDGSIVRVRLAVGKRHRLSYPGSFIIFIHPYGQPEAIAAMVRAFF